MHLTKIGIVSVLLVGLSVACIDSALADTNHSGHLCKAIGIDQSALVYSESGAIVAMKDISVSCPIISADNFGIPFQVIMYFGTRGSVGSGNLITCQIVRINSNGQRLNGTSRSTSAKMDGQFEMFSGTDTAYNGSHLIGANVLCKLKQYANIKGFTRLTRD